MENLQLLLLKITILQAGSCKKSTLSFAGFLNPIPVGDRMNMQGTSKPLLRMEKE